MPHDNGAYFKDRTSSKNIQFPYYDTFSTPPRFSSVARPVASVCDRR
ncbi:MAG: hypothetical protein NTW21_09195 [Verrucomicrobia bacterium]|nr:hypothetical protein [Verrucomicrobiota bacterium]